MTFRDLLNPTKAPASLERLLGDMFCEDATYRLVRAGNEQRYRTKGYLSTGHSDGNLVLMVKPPEE
jgi:hypothetical protein